MWKEVRFVTDNGVLVTYAIALVTELRERLWTVRLYDNAHGINEMHRYTRTGGKQPGEVFTTGLHPRR